VGRRSVHVDQLSLVGVKPAPGRRRRVPFVHVHTPEERAAFDHSIANSMRIRGDALSDDEKWCPGDCGKRIHRDRRHCGRRWCDAVRPSWAVIDMPSMTSEQQELVSLLLDPVVCAPNAP